MEWNKNFIQFANRNCIIEMFLLSCFSFIVFLTIKNLFFRAGCNTTPNFLRQSSGGGRSAGNQSSKGGIPCSMGGKQPKFLQFPQFEKVELKRSENAWVRPSDQDKNLSKKKREIKVSHQTNYFFKGDSLLKLTQPKAIN